MSPEDFESVADRFSEAALLVAADGIVLGANRHFRQYGLDPRQFAGRFLAELSTTSPEDVSTYLRNCARNREPLAGVLALASPKGESIVFRCDGAVLHHDPQGTETQLLIKFVPRDQATAQFLVLNQKIADLNEEMRRRRLLQQELLSQGESLRVTLASIGDGVIACDTQGRITFLNPIAERLTGWSQEDAYGRPITEVFHIVNEASRLAVENPALRALREGMIVGLANHTVLISRDGTERPIDDSAAPIQDGVGEVLGVVLVFRDASERRAAEIEQGRLAALVDSSEDAILGVTFDGVLTDWNAGAEKMFGFSAQEIIGTRIFSSIVPPDREEESREALRRIKGGERLEPFETIRLRKDGQRVPVAIRISPILDSEGTAIGASAIDRDISKQKASERRRNARLAVTQIFAQEDDTQRAIAGIMDILGAMFEWDAGFFWEADREANDLRCQDVWRSNKLASDASSDDCRQLVIKPGEGLPGSVWQTREPFWITDAGEEGGVVPARMSEIGPVRSAFACPVAVSDECLGVIEWLSYQVRERDEDLIEMMTTIAAQIGQFLERREAERKLRRSEQDLNDFFDNAAIGLRWVGPDGTILRANRAELEMLGYTRDEYVGHRITEFHDDPGVIDGIFQYLDAGDQLHDHEASLRCKDGSIKQVLIDSNILWEEGRFVHSRSFTRDVTQKKLAETALQDSEERLRLALEAGRMGSWEWNIPTGKIIWSSTLERIHGLPPGAFDGTFDAYQQDIHPEDRQRVLALIQQTVNEGRDHHLEYRIVWPDGSTHWLESRGRLFRDQNNQPMRLIGICSDITERKQLEHSLRFLAESSRSLSLLVDYRSTLQKLASLSVPDFADWCAVDMLEADGSLLRLAVAHCDPAKVELAEKVYERFPPDPQADHGVMKVVRTGESDFMTEIPDSLLQQAAFDEEHLRIIRELSLKSYICVPLRAKERLLGVITFVAAESGRRYSSVDLAMAEDLALRAAIAIENALLYQKVRDADRRKDEFLAMLAHELRNPLAPIRSGLDILAMDGGSHHEIIELMQEQVEHVVRLVDDLLDVSRIMRGKVELRKETIDLADLIKRSVHAVRPTINNHQQVLIVTDSPDPLYLNVDPVRIVQVIENLLTNASKYMDAGGKIDVIIERQNEHAVITVRDTGVGIEKELLPHVFDLFTQSSRSLDRAQGGLGIGLTLVQSLVEMHDGSVSAHSDGPGQGSTFTVRLPLVETASATQEQFPGEPEIAACRIVVVDDNRSAAWLLKMLLMKVGDHVVETAPDGPTALLKIKECQPHIIFLDIGLPGMDGHEVAREIRRQSEFDDVLLIALTGYGQEEDRRNSFAAGFDLHLVKPPSIDQIRNVFSHPKLARQREER